MHVFVCVGVIKYFWHQRQSTFGKNDTAFLFSTHGLAAESQAFQGQSNVCESS